MGRSTLCYEKEGLKRGPWTTEEDQKLTAYIQQHGHGSWSSFAGESRTENEIKNHWNTHLKKRLIKMGSIHDPQAPNRCTWLVWPRMSRLKSKPYGSVGKSSPRSRSEGSGPQFVEQASLPSPNPTEDPPGTDPLPLNPRPKCIDVLKAWQAIVTGMFNFPTSISNSPNASVQMQELEDWMDEPTSSMTALTQYATENAWFVDSVVAAADFNEGSSEPDTLIGIPVSFSCMEVEASNGSCPIADMFE
ncbi:hypothetical protein F3Y22_tig00109958pilonHSYRG00051 [Hibiscus syriacus]|uniref:Uncharacterized protein n=1 Tax=Hibiscus syriacus TaxID=106335 RepID=A0A6A3BWV6_HIBSY|nr:hypothetical protein F3Y22_tig00109958pilonHSYRG00051 [Hibiscus syriacus]